MSTPAVVPYDFSHCLVPAQIAAGPPWVIVLGAVISTISYVYVFLQYYIYKTPEFVGHPTSLAIYKYQIEALLVLQFLHIPFQNDPQHFYSATYYYNNQIPCPADKCCANEKSVVLVFITQFCLLGSELWFAAICRDLQLAYTNPFTSYKENKQWFIWSITLLSMASSFALIYGSPPYDIGVANTSFIWIQDIYKNSFYNPLSIGFFYAWFVLLSTYCLYVVFKYGGGGDVNLAGTVSTRLPIMKKCRRFVLGYLSFWLCTIIAECVYLVATDAFWTQRHENFSVIGYCLAYRGPYAVSVVVFSNWDTITWAKLLPFWFSNKNKIGRKSLGSGRVNSTSGSSIADDEDEDGDRDRTLQHVTEILALAPHLNKALRTEILFFTSEGIRAAALENSSRMYNEHIRLSSKSSDCGIRRKEEEKEKGKTANAHDDRNLPLPGKMKYRVSDADHIIARTFLEGSDEDDDDDNDTDKRGGTSARPHSGRSRTNSSKQRKSDSSSNSNRNMRESYKNESFAFSITCLESKGIRTISNQFDHIPFDSIGIGESTNTLDEIENGTADLQSVSGATGLWSEGVARGSIMQANKGLSRVSVSRNDTDLRSSLHSVRASLDEGQVSRLSIIEEAQDKAISGLLDTMLLKHNCKQQVAASTIAAEKRANWGGVGGGARRSERDLAMDNLRSSFGLVPKRSSHSSVGSANVSQRNSNNVSMGSINPIILESVKERQSTDSSRSTLYGESESKTGIEMNIRHSDTSQRSHQSLHERDGDKDIRSSSSRSTIDGSERKTDIAAHDGSVITGADIHKRNNECHVFKSTDTANNNNLRTLDEDIACGVSSHSNISFSNAIKDSHAAKYVGPVGKDAEDVAREVHKKDETKGILSHFLLKKTAMAGAAVKNKILSVFHNEIYDFEFTDYNPSLFSYIRQLCGIADEEYAKAFEHVTKENFSEGRSGAFTFFSAKGEYFVKTHNRDEVVALREMLPQYVRYLSKHKHSLLIRFLGAHKIKMYGKVLYFVVMCSVFPANIQVHERYDLKGSWVNRHGKSGVFVSGGGDVVIKESPLYLDNDIHQKIELHPSAANSLYRQVKFDVQFLESQNLMDYSLLVGVVKSRLELLDNIVPTDVYNEATLAHIKRENPFLTDSTGGLRPVYVEGASVFYVGIIDMLQKWDFNKKLEYYFKTYILQKSSRGISAVDPKHYRTRFISRVMHKLFVSVDPNATSKAYSLGRGRNGNDEGSDSDSDSDSTTNIAAEHIANASFFNSANSTLDPNINNIVNKGVSSCTIQTAAGCSSTGPGGHGYGLGLDVIGEESGSSRSNSVADTDTTISSVVDASGRSTTLLEEDNNSNINSNDNANQLTSFNSAHASDEERVIKFHQHQPQPTTQHSTHTFAAKPSFGDADESGLPYSMIAQSQSQAQHNTSSSSNSSSRMLPNSLDSTSTASTMNSLNPEPVNRLKRDMSIGTGTGHSNIGLAGRSPLYTNDPKSPTVSANSSASAKTSELHATSTEGQGLGRDNKAIVKVRVSSIGVGSSASFSPSTSTSTSTSTNITRTNSSGSTSVVRDRNDSDNMSDDS